MKSSCVNFLYPDIEPSVLYIGILRDAVSFITPDIVEIEVEILLMILDDLSMFLMEILSNTSKFSAMVLTLTIKFLILSTFIVSFS